jgi:hypothetical protein
VTAKVRVVPAEEINAALSLRAKDYIGKTDWPKQGSLRVWHVPQIPGAPFYVPVVNVAQAKLVLKLLGDYDAFMLANHVRPEYSNANGLEVYYELGGWQEWHRASDDYSISDILMNESLDNV